MKTVKIGIKGIRPYIQHRRPSTEEEVKSAKEITKILQKNSFDPKAAKAETEIGLYRKEDGEIYIPSSHFQEALIKAGTAIQVQGQGKKTYKDYMKSYVIVDPDEITIQPQQYDIDSRWVRIQRSGVMRYRPIFKKWNASFQLLVTDDTLPLDTIKEIMEIAGARVGIGDYRPKYGLFQVTEFNEQ